MRTKLSSANTGIRKSTGAGLLLIVVAALTLEATSLLQNYFSRKGLMEEAQLRAESLLETTRLQISDASHQAESAVRPAYRPGSLKTTLLSWVLPSP